MFERLKNIFKKTEPPTELDKKPKPASQKKKPQEPVLSEKEKATLAGEPYIAILKVDVDPSNINSGGFEMDWNDKFILNLIRAGYKQREDDTDTVLVDRWFQTVCRNIALEVYEQQAADSSTDAYNDLRRVRRRDLGEGRSEIS
jgi:hypothetical protein